MRDLEIRGAGNLLGGEQSGHIAAVGFDLYCQLVTEAVGELKGERSPESRSRSPSTCRCTPTCRSDYVSRDDVRMEAYRRLAAVTDPADVDDVRAEWEDRYGPPPPAGRGAARRRAAAGGVRAARDPQRHGARSAVRIRGLELKASPGGAAQAARVPGARGERGGGVPAVAGRSGAGGRRAHRAARGAGARETEVPIGSAAP